MHVDHTILALTVGGFTCMSSTMLSYNSHVFIHPVPPDQYIGKSAPFYLCSILAFVDFLARLAVIPPRPNDHQTIEPHAITDDMRLNTPTRQHSPVIAVPSKNTHIMHGFISALRSPLVLVVLGATVVVSLVVSGMEPTLPLHLEQVFHADNTTIGLMFTVWW